jgi:hypothetical protein
VRRAGKRSETFAESNAKTFTRGRCEGDTPATRKPASSTPRQNDIAEAEKLPRTYSTVSVEITGESVRYRLLDSIRAFALDRLSDTYLHDTDLHAHAREVHARWFAHAGGRGSAAPAVPDRVTPGSSSTPTRCSGLPPRRTTA